MDKDPYELFHNACCAADQIGTSIENLVRGFYGIRTKDIFVREDADDEWFSITIGNITGPRIIDDDLEGFFEWTEKIWGDLPMHPDFDAKQDRIEDQLVEAREVVEELRESQDEVF